MVLGAIPTDPANTLRSTADTVRAMGAMMRESAADPYVRAEAQRALLVFGSPRETRAMLAALFFWCKARVRFVRDEVALDAVGHGDEFEFLISPSVLVRLSHPTGDCDDFTMLLGALILSVPALAGLAPRIVTVAAEPDDPARFSHVFLAVVLDGAVSPLDASHGPFPGWQIPNCRITRRVDWALTGEPLTAGVAVAADSHDGARVPVRFQGFERAGLGDFSDFASWLTGSDPAQVASGGAVAPTTSVEDFFNNVQSYSGVALPQSPSGAVFLQTPGALTPSTFPSAASGGSSPLEKSLLALLPGLATTAETIATRAITPLQSGEYIQTATSVQARNVPGAVPSSVIGGAGAALSTTGLSTSSLLLLAVVGIGALVLVGKGK